MCKKKPRHRTPVIRGKMGWQREREGGRGKGRDAEREDRMVRGREGWMTSVTGGGTYEISDETHKKNQSAQRAINLHLGRMT